MAACGGNERGRDLAAPPPRWDDALFATFRVTFGGLLRAWFRLRVEGPLPPTGPCVLAANHTSFLDPLVLGAVQPRRIVYLMTEVVWRSPSLGWFYRWNRAIPLGTRGGNRDALRTAHAVLEQGRMVGIFPEGGLSRDGLPMLGSPGAVSLMLAAGVRSCRSASAVRMPRCRRERRCRGRGGSRSASGRRSRRRRSKRPRVIAANVCAPPPR